jgi:regulatory protein SWI6
MLSQSKADFDAEMKEKQGVLDKTTAALRESSSTLKEERARLERLRAKVREREDLDHKIKNHRRAQAEIQQEVQNASPVGAEPVSIGEADRGLDLNGQLQHVEQVFANGAVEAGMPLSQEQLDFLSGMERAEVLVGRVQAYREHNERLEQRARELRAKSSQLEDKYKKIIVLCTGADDGKVDDLLDSLVQAVISEQKEMGDGTELSRVRDFLRLVQRDGGTA